MLNVKTKIIRLPELIIITGLSRTTIYTRIKAGLLPSPVSLGGRAVGWLTHEVEELITALISGKDNKEIESIIKSQKEVRYSAKELRDE